MSQQMVDLALANWPLLFPLVTAILSFLIKHLNGGWAKMASAISVDVPLFLAGVHEVVSGKADPTVSE